MYNYTTFFGSLFSLLYRSQLNGENIVFSRGAGLGFCSNLTGDVGGDVLGAFEGEMILLGCSLYLRFKKLSVFVSFSVGFIKAGWELPGSGNTTGSFFLDCFSTKFRTFAIHPVTFGGHPFKKITSLLMSTTMKGFALISTFFFLYKLYLRTDKLLPHI
jgi:hypothetical protein